MSREEFAERNPWWLDDNAINEDRSISEWEGSRFKWEPRLGQTFEWDVDVIYVLRGPRQVGKTTMMMLKIRDLLGRGVSPRRIFYWPCDLVDGPERLVQIVGSYLTMVRESFKDRRYIVLDEISSVRDWQKGIKSLYDAGQLRNCTVILTGSHSIDLRKATESLARRRGEVEKLRYEVPDKILLPAKFSEYVETRSEKIRKVMDSLGLKRTDNRHDIWSRISKGSLPRQFRELELISKEAESLFRDYLLTGGIPKIVDTYIAQGRIPRSLYDGYTDLLVRDILRWGGQEHILRQIIRRITETFGTNITLNGLRQETDVSSHHTTGTYLDFLKDSFATIIIHRLDRNKEAPVTRDSRKIHFGDPFIFHALRAWSSGKDPQRDALRFVSEPEMVSKLVESIVAEHFVRLLFSYQPSGLFDYTQSLFHWESKLRQLDLVMRIDDKYLPAEVKYQNRISSEDSGPILEFQKGGKSSHGLLLTKSTLAEKRSHLELPVHLALLTI